MAISIPEDKINEVRSITNIVDVISDYVSLRPSGKNFVGKSPFNPTEKTGSFVVSPEKQIYKCFSTGKGGNVFTFIMEMEKLSFVESVQFVAKRVGIIIEQKRSIESSEEITDYKILNWAAKFFFNTLHSKEGLQALHYLEKRSIEKKTIVEFGIGYAKDSWSSLLDAAKLEPMPIDKLIELGLITKNEKGHIYDTYRDRIIYPIFSTAGKVLGFAGRVLVEKDKSPKYVNSPESKLYEKSKILYGLHFAEKEIRKKNEVFLTEGYMDTISLHQGGILNTVASCGTALTSQQIVLLKRYTTNVTFLYDADAAGLHAMMKGIDLFLAQNFSIKVVTLPDGYDPDNYIHDVGREKFSTYIKENKISFLTFKINHLKQLGEFETPEQSIASIREIIQSILKLPDDLSREVFFQELSSQTNIPLSIIHKEAKGTIKKKSSFKRAADDALQPNLQLITENKLEPAEKSFLKYLLESMNHGFAIVKFAISYKKRITLHHSFSQQIFDFIFTRYEYYIAINVRSIDVVNEINYIETHIKDDKIRDFMVSLLFEPLQSQKWGEEDSKDYAKRCVKGVIESMEKILLDEMQLKLKENLTAIDKYPDNLSYLKIQNLLNKERQKLVREFETFKREIIDTL